MVTSNKMRSFYREAQGSLTSTALEKMSFDTGSARPGLCKDRSTIVDYWTKHNSNTLETLNNMNDNNLCLSLKQQEKFFMLKDKIMKWTLSQPEKTKLLYGFPPGLYAIPINDKYGFRHIFKNGGKTANIITKNRHIEKADFGSRKLFATVRDPIEHFLSGWSECGMRSENPKDPAFATNLKVDNRVKNWLQCVKRSTLKGEYRRPCKCSKHSYPQINFLLDIPGKNIDPNLHLIGDIQELPQLIEMVGLKYDKATIPERKVDVEKAKKFPTDKTLLSDKTIQGICNFVILDYYFFDFVPPEVCRDQIKADIASIAKVTL